jgi:hypothetical protein
METDRIKFLGNPWVNGHAIRDFFWSARLESSGIWFDLHLQTAEYRAEDTGMEIAINEEQSDWQSKIVWNNYHQCTLSSTYWDGTGFQVASREQPLDVEALNGQEFIVDPLPIEFDELRPFDIYLLGHDTVADHRIRFTQKSTSNQFAIDWRGRIALSYSGIYEFQHEFEAHVEAVEFEGIELPQGTQKEDAHQLLVPFVTNLDKFVLVSTAESLWFHLS